jgi:hypothetical protein
MKNLPHLSQYSSGKISDAAVFVAEDFGRDLKSVVKLIFSSQAKTINPEITKNEGLGKKIPTDYGWILRKVDPTNHSSGRLTATIDFMRYH